MPKQVVTESGIEVRIKKKKPKKKTGSKFIKTLVTVIIIIAVIYILTSTKTAEVAQHGNYTTTKIATVQEPYVIVEEYQDTEPLGPPKCGNTIMNFTTSVPWVAFAQDGSLICNFNLTNLESKEGTWEYVAYIAGGTGNRYDKETVGPNSTKTFMFAFDTRYTEPTCGISSISLPSIERCYFPAETFYKVVTKTRNVTRYRNVTTETEVVVANDTTVNETVNRFFGYPMISFGW